MNNALTEINTELDNYQTVLQTSKARMLDPSTSDEELKQTMTTIKQSRPSLIELQKQLESLGDNDAVKAARQKLKQQLSERDGLESSLVKVIDARQRAGERRQYYAEQIERLANETNKFNKVPLKPMSDAAEDRDALKVIVIDLQHYY